MIRVKHLGLALLTVCMFPLGKAHAQATGSAVCKLNASFQAVLRTVKNEEFLREVTSKCRRGDVVAYPISYTYVAKKTCDFSQQVITTGNEIICIFSGGQRADR